MWRKNWQRNWPPVTTRISTPAAGPVRPCTFSTEARRRLVENDPDQGEILCRCEGVTVGQVLEAIRRGAVTVDGVKRRTGACMGRCQGSRCGQRILALLARELAIPESAVLKDGPGSAVLGGRDGTL